MSRRSTWQTVRALGRGALGASAVLVCLAVLAAGAFALAGYRPLVIQTGSMGEAAPPKSLVIVRPNSDVQVGDVLVMRTSGRATVTHRVVDIERSPEGAVAVTRGDANPDIDPEPYALSDSELTARWVVRDAGGWLVQTRTPAIGLTLLIAIVSTFTFWALRRIWRPRSNGVLVVERAEPPIDVLAPAGLAPIPLPPPGVRRRFRRPDASKGRGRALVAAVAAGSGIVVGGAAFSLYIGVDTVTANSFTTSPCFDARLGSVQTGQHTNDTDGTSNVAITAVDPAKSFLMFSVSSDSNEPEDSQLLGRLASGTQVEFVRESNGAPPDDIVVEWTVVEYDCGVSVQRGVTAGPGAASMDIAISSVATENSFAFVSTTAQAAFGVFDADNLLTVELTDATTLRVEAGDTIPVGQQLAWQVVTFDGGDATTQQVTGSLGPADSNTTVTIPTTVDPQSTAVFASVRYTGGGGNEIDDRALRVRLVDGDTIELERGQAQDTLDVVIQVVEFADGTTVRHGTVDLAPAESVVTVTVPPIQVSRSSVTSTVMTPSSLSGGSTDYSADDVIGEASGRMRFVDERTIEIARDATTGTASFAFQAITWNGPNWADLDSPFRQRIDVEAGSVVTPTGYTTPLTFDHAQLVTDGLSLADGTDLRVWRHNGVGWTELHRVLDDASSFDDAATTFWFRTSEAIAADDSATYWLYFGDDTPDPVLDDPTQVFLAVEDFDDGTLGIFEDRTGGTAWYDDQPWTRRIVVDIDGSGLSGPVADHPVLVRVTDPDLTANLQADADDVKFTADDGTTVLAHHVEEWDPGADTLTAWVRVPSVGTGTTQLHLHYGSPDAPDQADARAAWAGREVAFPLAADPALDRPALDDQGPAQRDGVALAGALSAVTPAGPGVALDGTLDRLESQPFALPDASFTASAWFRADTFATDVTLLAQGDPAAAGVFDLRLDSATGELAARVATTDGGASPISVSGGTVTAGTWHHVAMTWDGTSLAVHIDGIQAATTASSGRLARPGPVPLVIGADPVGADALDGTIGHVEIDAGAWSADRLALASGLFDGSRTSAAAATGGTWFEQGNWTARWPLTIDADSVAGPLTDYPLLVSFAEPTIAAEAGVAGLDLVFTSSDGTTRLDHWIESWDDPTGALVAWVRIPTLDGVTDETIYVYAGNGTALDQQDAEAVWGDDVDLVVTGSP